MQSQNILNQRGILPAAQLADWQATHNGWRIPLYRPDGSRYPKAAWKAYDSHATPKYRIPYKKDECAIYLLPGTLDAIAASGGRLIIAGGFVDNLTFHAAGFPNVISFLGESAIPDDLLSTLQSWNVTSVHVYPHLDNTGKNASQKIKAALQDVIPCTSYALPANLGEGGDINDLWRRLEFNCSAFCAIFAKLPILTNPRPTAPQLPVSRLPVSNQPGTGYGTRALEGEAEQLARIKNGRNNALNRAAFRIGQLVGAGLLDQVAAENSLLQAALSTGLSLKEILPTLKSGLTAGISQPRREIPRRHSPPVTAEKPPTPPDRALPTHVREHLLHQKFETSRGSIGGTTVARLLDILLGIWEPGHRFTAGELVPLCAPYHIGQSTIFAILAFFPEKPLFPLVSHAEVKKRGRKSRIYQMPDVDHICVCLGIERDLLALPMSPEALMSSKAYRREMHLLYLKGLGETTAPTSHFAERLSVGKGTIANYERELGAYLRKEARFKRQPIHSIKELPDEAAAYKAGLFLENGAGGRGRVNARNYARSKAQTGQVFLCRRLSSRRICLPAILYCQFCGQAQSAAFGTPHSCQTCRDLYSKTGKAYWGEMPPPVAPEELMGQGVKPAPGSIRVTDSLQRSSLPTNSHCRRRYSPAPMPDRSLPG